jgi:hypothetical protein
VALAFDAGFLIDDVQNTIAFADGFGRAFGQACSTGNAIFKNFHGHGYFSYCAGLVQRLPPGILTSDFLNCNASQNQYLNLTRLRGAM